MISVVAIASDHGGLGLKSAIVDHLDNRAGITRLIDLGTNNKTSVDYPDYAEKVCQALRSGEAEAGILCCGTGIGMSIKANRYPGIRAAVVFSDFSATMAKAHNNANILCLGERTTAIQDSLRYVDIWLDTAFEAGRHLARIQKLDRSPLLN